MPLTHLAITRKWATAAVFLALCAKSGVPCSDMSPAATALQRAWSIRVIAVLRSGSSRCASRRDGGGAIHVAIWVPYEEAEKRLAAALAAGGRMVREDLASLGGR